MVANGGFARLLPESSPALRDILGSDRDAVAPPIRAEIFGPQRFAQHGRSLAETHRVADEPARAPTFSPRLNDNIAVLREAHAYIGAQAATGYDVSPAAEWLLENFHLIEAQIEEIREGLPRRYYRSLPTLVDEPLAGLPRVYGIAWAFVAHTDSGFDDDLLGQFLGAYQEVRDLRLSEMWALPTTLRVVLVENLRRLAERVAANKAARESANLCFDQIDRFSVHGLDELRQLHDRRGVGRVFLAQMAQRLQDVRSTGHERIDDWLRHALPDLAAMQAQQGIDQAADNLSVSNAVRSLRAIGDADWPELVGRTSLLMRRMLGSATFAAETPATRDETLHAIERLARRGRCSEQDVAAVLLGLMQTAAASEASEGVTGRGAPEAMAGHWTHGAGRPALLAALGLRRTLADRWPGAWHRAALPVYLGTVGLGTLALVGWALMRPHLAGPAMLPPWLLPGLAGALMLLPASEVMVAVVNRLIGESLRPRPLPRLTLAGGIPPANRVLVVVPAMLTSPEATRQLVHRLQLHHLANPEREAQFALLGDWADADTASTPGDAPLLADALQRLQALNAEHPVDPGQAPRFILLHRERRYSETERRWIGWERKRGKLEQLISVLATGVAGDFIDLGAASRLAGARHVLTLDSDTQLPPGRLRELVGVAAHPHNRPRLDAAARRVVGGYGILQPRIVTPLPPPRELTRFHRLYAGRCGIDPYSAATSEVYQDVFGEGSFTGKGLLDVEALHAVLGARLPEGRVLSHDLLEGAIARCAAVNDVTVIEDAPFHADVAASRLHRWTRGDWQLLPFLLQAGRYRLGGVHRWKMLDNLRRSLVAPASVGLLLVALGSDAVSLGAALAIVFAALLTGPLMGALTGLVPHRTPLARRHFFRGAGLELVRVLAGGAWLFAQLLQAAIMAVDAIVRAVWRMAVSQRHLLEWTTAATAQAAAGTRFAQVFRLHLSEPPFAALLAGVLWAVGTPHPAMASALCALWAASPLWTWWVSRPIAPRAQAALPEADRDYLDGVARDTWRFFERCVGPDDHHLPPDNLQTLPVDALAMRTSPTNIGLYLLSAACARRFGWIGTQELLARLDATLATLATLQRYRGHFLNWYDTRRAAPLLPMYVSTVDSGNLSGHLLAVAQACRAFALQPHDGTAAQAALAASRARLAPLLARVPELLPPRSALAQLLALPDRLDTWGFNVMRLDPLLVQSRAEIAALAPDATDADRAAGLRDALAWRLGDHLATLASAWRDVQAEGAGLGPETTLRLVAMARACQDLAWAPDYGFLYHRHRHLLHLGCRVETQELDAGFYDLLASESRLTSLVAIAQGVVPAVHWAALGRPFHVHGAQVGLRSWSGSMFEYLMPGLVIAEPEGSLLRDAGEVALREQIACGELGGAPWGISESAHAGRDHTLAYQYGPQGVPRLALRRTPPEERVVAPYATALAAQLDPAAAVLNLRALEALGARGRYGFIEALDYSPARQVDGGLYTPVCTFMSHHQGMTLVALANVLLDGVAQRWGMADAHFEAVASLLHERAPREVAADESPPSALPQQALRRHAPGLLREFEPGESALEPTQVLSNGRYTTTLRANGAGWSRWGRTGVGRTRDDALRDAHGHFAYLRWDRQPRPVSITQHPAPDPAAHYKSLFHADRVCFDAAWPEVQAHETVWVSPEDDVEFRRIEVHNLGERMLDLELISAFDVTLCEPAADEAHPAFTGLFVRARWQASEQALVFERTPRLATERAVQMAHFLADVDPQAVSIGLQTDRQRWLGRNRGAARPRASLDAPPPVGPEGSAPLDTGLDPVCVMSVRLRMAPGSSSRVTFATAVSDDPAVLQAVIDKYRQPGHVQRASLMSATLAGIRLRAWRIGPGQLTACQSLTTALVHCVTRPEIAAVADAPPAARLVDRRLLWRFGLSGDRPILVVSAGVMQGVGLIRALAQCLRMWTWAGIACDLVVINSEPASYQMALHREVVALRERHLAELEARGAPAETGLVLLRADELLPGETSTLQGLARLWFHADGRPLGHHVQDWLDRLEAALERRLEVSHAVLPLGRGDTEAVAVSTGRFARASGAFEFVAGAGRRPARPWINVLSNPVFGAQVSEAGGGYTWAVNSRMNQLTAWSNDAVSDTPSEWFLLQDTRSREVWNVAPSVGGDDTLDYDVAHGQGLSRIAHRRGDAEVSVQWCVDAHSAVKQVRLSIANRGTRTLHLRAVALAEWMMGANRADRGSVVTALWRQRLPDAGEPRKLTALLATQPECAAGFGGGTAFLAVADAADASEEWTCDRRECFDARGRLVLPDHFGQLQGAGLDPCAALAVTLRVPAGERVERVFVLGYADSADGARQLATQALAVPAATRLSAVQARWDALLGATTVSTPDPLFDAMMNRWLLYQAVACRLWAKAGFYQAGGATGFRDQLQDALALAWAAPAMLREQILRCAARQFVEGDVQHWWHAPRGAGVRTHFSDDLLWLVHACVHYLRATGDVALLDEPVSFIEGSVIPAGAEDAYDTPQVSDNVASVYEHAARTLDRSLAVGAHGLPLMGTGDWNDGMNRVGHEGRGESVWLAWFLCRLVTDFAPWAHARGDVERAGRWERAAQGWREALEGPAWDGAWYRRAFFDDGSALGAQANPEARIDLIAQAWAVLSGAAPLARQRLAMASAARCLTDDDTGLIRLLDPPLAHAVPSAGYIQAYPPGVRENGGQYSHAGVWAVMAQARLAQAEPGDVESADRVYTWFTGLSPAHRAMHPVRGPAYLIEPYAVAGDVYTQPPYVGRGGWSWYTGAAAWMHRAGIESIFGLRMEAQRLSLRPCLPSHWPTAELSLRRDGRTLRFVFVRTGAAEAEAMSGAGARRLEPGAWVDWRTPTGDALFVVPLEALRMPT